MKKEASAETLTWLPDASEMARRIGAHDWAATPLGPIMEWPQALRFTVQLILGSDATMVAPWGPDGILLYNDAYSRLIGPRSSTALGRPVFDVFPELRAVLEPQFDEVRAGRAVKVADQPYPFVRTTDLEPAWFDVSHSAVRDENGAIAGILTILTETTNRVDADRQLRESEARHRYLIGSWAQAVWETDAEGVVIADSPSWRAYTGQTFEEWKGYGWLDAIHPDDRAYAERQWREACEGSLTPSFVFVRPMVVGAGPTSAPRHCSMAEARSRNGWG